MSTYAQRVQLGAFYLSGVIQGAAKLYHYEAGTSTLKNIWSDRGMGTTLAQPFVADADGVFNFFADGLYKLIICGPDSTGPSDDVLYTLDNWQLIDRTDPTFSEGSPIASSSAIAVGPEIWAHVTGTTNIDTITGTIPFVWLVFDGALSLVHSANLLCPASTDSSVAAGDAVFLLNDGSGAWRIAGKIAQVLLQQANDVIVNASDGRANSVDRPFTVKSTTTNTPSTGIGTGILVQAESADEVPSDVGALDFVTSDVTAGSEDTYLEILLRTAGAALAAAYRFVTTTAYKTIFTTAHTADRTYAFFDRSTTLGIRYDAPTSTGSGSTLAHEGSVQISANQNLSGVHYYTDFTLDSGDTITVPAGEFFVAIYATGTITINGTIDAGGAGSLGGTAGNVGVDGTDQIAGNGGSGGAGGRITCHGVQIHTSGQFTAEAIPWTPYPMGLLGGASGGGGSGASGGRGGGSIVLVAPTVVLAATATLDTSGNAGGTGGGSGGGGGGGAGNVYILTHSFTDNGATFTQTAGSGGSGTPAGSAGQAGVKQINIY